MSYHETTEQLMTRLRAAWDAGDAEAYAACFTPDATYVAFDGTTSVGRRAIADSHRPLFAKWLAGSTLVQLDARETVLAEGVVLSSGQGAVLPRGKIRVSPARLSTASFVMVKGTDGWRVAAFQNTRYRPFAASLLGRILALFGGRP